MKKHLWSEPRLWFLWHHTTDTGYVHLFYICYTFHKTICQQKNFASVCVCVCVCVYVYIYIYIYIYSKKQSCFSLKKMREVAGN